MTTSNNIILFDGFCNLCNGSVQFISKRDKRNTFTYFPLLSDEGRELLKKFNTTPEEHNSIVYLKNGKILFKSAAVLNIVNDLHWPWRILYGFIIVPRFLRDFIYDVVAKYRYRIFGRR